MARSNTIAAKLEVKRNETYQKSISFVRRRVAFDILKTCIIYLRGDRGSKRKDPIVDLNFGLKEIGVVLNFIL